MFNALAYCSYLIISICITVFVSRTLSKNGDIYLIDGFNGNDALAKPVNHMPVIGFYLLNLGFLLMRMQSGNNLNTIEDFILHLSSNTGLVLLVLGFAHFFNMFVIHKFRDNRTHHHAANEFEARQA